MELSELTNKELKNILRQNQVKNYSKLNKKNLVKKVNQLIKSLNGGNSKKKYRLRGGIVVSPRKNDPPGPPPVATPGATTQGPNHSVNNKNLNPANPGATTTPSVSDNSSNESIEKQVASDSGLPQNQGNPTQVSTASNKNNRSRGNSALFVYSANPNNKNYKGREEPFEQTKYGNIKAKDANNSGKNECGACTIQ